VRTPTNDSCGPIETFLIEEADAYATLGVFKENTALYVIFRGEVRGDDALLSLRLRCVHRLMTITDP
jgi:hypothetical protein